MASMMDMLDTAPEVGVVVAVIASVRILAWLIGLVIVLRGCPPADRPKVLRAYGASQPRPSRHIRPDLAKADLKREKNEADL